MLAAARRSHSSGVRALFCGSPCDSHAAVALSALPGKPRECGGQPFCVPLRRSKWFLPGEQALQGPLRGMPRRERRHRRMASMGLLESVEASPRPHGSTTLVCLRALRSKRCDDDSSISARTLRWQIAIVHRPLTWLPSEQRNGCGFAVACRLTSSVLTRASSSQRARRRAGAVGRTV